MATEAKSVDADFIFRAFTACPQDLPTLILDVRPHKEWKHLHIIQAFCVRLSSNGQVLADYSQSSYTIKWAQDCWWNKNVIVYGDSNVRKDHPVVAFLAKQGKCKMLYYYKDGFESFERAYPFLCTASVKANSIKKYPSQILPKFLYLGDWANAVDTERLAELNIKRILTIHNHPENLKPAPGMRPLALALPDIDSADISQHFQPAFEFIEEARQKGQAVLVHCGAGVSRSATLCMMYLMRRNIWGAQKAKDYVVGRRSLVCINDGFWRTLCALEGSLGISHRSDPSATSGFRGADAPELDGAAMELSRDAAGEKVEVRMLTTAELKAEGDEPAAKRARTDGAGPGPSGGSQQQKRAGARGVKVVLEVHKPEGVVGQLHIGPLRFHQRCVLGRAPACDVVLEHQSISRQHAQITVDAAGAAFITDLQSGHGTKVDDMWVKAHAAKQLHIGTVLQFGASTRAYKVLSVEQDNS